MSLGEKYVFAVTSVFGLASVLCVLMALGMFMSSSISVMSPPPCLCSMSVRMEVPRFCF